jgi:ABC-type bacteriocin/lantibiotic exporter with double-glycine peptidase domain
MFQISLIILGCSVGIALLFHLYAVSKIKFVLKETSGTIMSINDLELIKEVINLNMKLAIYYIVFYVMLIVVLGIMVMNKLFLEVILILFPFGVITLVIGLMGKKYENKIRNMEVKSGDPKIKETFERYLKEWKEPRLQLGP